jgi:molybdopterin-binding protein
MMCFGDATSHRWIKEDVPYLDLPSKVDAGVNGAIVCRASDATLWTDERSGMSCAGDAVSMKISARNILAGKVTAIKKGPISALVTIEIAPKVEITASITADALKELKLKKGSKASAVIKASSILVGVE